MRYLNNHCFKIPKKRIVWIWCNHPSKRLWVGWGQMKLYQENILQVGRDV